MIKYINSKGKPWRRAHRKKSTSEIGNKGFLRPKIKKKNKGKDISRRRVHAERHGILREMSFGGNGAKKCYFPTAPCFQAGEAVLKLTQIGKECHSHCEIYKAMGDCIMPREGVFTEVIKGGRIKTGDEITMLPLKKDRPFTGAVITLSDKGQSGRMRADR